VNNIKFGVLACGLIGLIAVFLPWVSFMGHSASLWSARAGGEGAQVYMVMVGFLAPLVMGIMAVAKPPAQRWQWIVSLIGFAFVLFKLRSGLPTDIFKAPFGIGAKLMGLGAIAGLVFSIITLAKPETAK